MRADGTELVLAFDGDCHRCRGVAAAVARSCPELEVLPLADYRVAAWRAEVGGLPWAPTLLTITPGDDRDVVRAWCGPRLVPALVARLGPRRAWAVARAVLRTPSPGRGA